MRQRQFNYLHDGDSYSEDEITEAVPAEFVDIYQVIFKSPYS